jgi:HSP20 family protein
VGNGTTREESTMLLRYDPFRELDRLVQAPALRTSAMPMDAYRDGDRFVVHFDIPGANPDSIDVTVEKNALTVKAERSWQPSEGQEELITERPQGTFTRQIMLSESIDPEQISATYDNGVLTVIVPIAEQAKTRKVQVSRGNGASKAIDANSSGRSTATATP